MVCNFCELIKRIWFCGIIVWRLGIRSLHLSDVYYGKYRVDIETFWDHFGKEQYLVGCGLDIGKNEVELRIFFSSQLNIHQCAFFAETRLFSWSSFSNAYGTLLIMENFRWQLTDHGKFFLVSCLPLEKNLQKFNFFHRQLAKYQGLFKLPWLKSDHGKGV